MFQKKIQKTNLGVLGEIVSNIKIYLVHHKEVIGKV
jgi:hypothetical protein